MAFSAAFACVFSALLARFVLHGQVTGRSLAISVGRASGSPEELLRDRGACRRTGHADGWRYEVTGREGSGAASYRVVVRPGSSCWDERLADDSDTKGMPREVGDYIHRWQWSLVSLLG